MQIAMPSFLYCQTIVLFRKCLQIAYNVQTEQLTLVVKNRKIILFFGLGL